MAEKSMNEWLDAAYSDFAKCRKNLYEAERHRGACQRTLSNKNLKDGSPEYNAAYDAYYAAVDAADFAECLFNISEKNIERMHWCIRLLTKEVA